MNNKNKTETDSQTNPKKFYEDAFDLREFFLMLWASKNIILVSGLISFLGFMAYALNQPNNYTSDSLLTVSDSLNENPLSSLTSKYGGLAAMVGVSVQTETNSKSNLVMATIKSREFFQHLSEFKKVLPSLYAAEGYDSQTKSINYDKDLYNPEKGGWQINKPTFMEAHHEYLKGLTIARDEQTQFIYLAVNHYSPEFSFYLAELILQEVNNVIRQKNLEESKKALNFLKEQLDNREKIQLKETISQLIEAQLQIQMIANVREDYILRPIDKAYLPLGKSGPNRVQISLLGLIFGLILSIFGILLRTYLFKKT